MHELTINDLKTLLKKKQAALSKIEKIEHWMDVTYQEEMQIYNEFEKTIFSKYGKNSDKGRVVTVKDLPGELMKAWVTKNAKQRESQELYSKYSRTTLKRIKEKVGLVNEISDLNTLIYFEERKRGKYE